MDLKLLDFAKLRPRSVAAAPLVFPGPSQVRAYWEGLRAGGAIPDRAALDPRGLSGVLDRVFLAERIGRGLVQVRIAGSGLAEVAGMDLRGLPLSCLFSAEARPALAEVVEAVAAGTRVAEMDLASDRGNGAAVARLLLLPLNDGPQRRLVLGCIGSHEVPPRSKFQILRRIDEQLVLDPAAPAPAVVPPRLVSLRRQAHLTLVHSTGE
jgi:hypothetical protein